MINFNWWLTRADSADIATRARMSARVAIATREFLANNGVRFGFYRNAHNEIDSGFQVFEPHSDATRGADTEGGRKLRTTGLTLTKPVAVYLRELANAEYHTNGADSDKVY